MLCGASDEAKSADSSDVALAASTAFAAAEKAMQAASAAFKALAKRDAAPSPAAPIILAPTNSLPKTGGGDAPAGIPVTIERVKKIQRSPSTVREPLPIGKDEFKCAAWGIYGQGTKHEPLWIPRGKCGDMDVQFDLLYSGICHSDIHIGGEESLGPNQWPFVGGHELFGIVTEVGKSVTKFKVGDKVGVGCIVDSCLDCEQCKAGDENLCLKGLTGTYGGVRTFGRVPGNQELPTYGGYSATHVVHEQFAIRIPDGVPDEAVAPIMCAGITMYSPLKNWGALNSDRKRKVGIIGIGGLGTMGIKYARAMGHDVVAFSRSATKEAIALEKGATEFACSKDPESMKKFAMSCDLIINTIAVHHDIMPYMGCLKKKGVIVQLGIVSKPMEFHQIPLFFNQNAIAGSLIGGIADTEECLQFAAKHGIYPDVELVTAKQITEIWETLIAGNKEGKRYVIDIKKSLADKSFMPADGTAM